MEPRVLHTARELPRIAFVAFVISALFSRLCDTIRYDTIEEFNVDLFFNLNL